MTGLIEHFYRLALLRLLGSIILALSAWTAGRGYGYLDKSLIPQSRQVRAGVGCQVMVPWAGPVVPPACAFEVAGSLPLLWSIGYKKQLRMVTRDDLTWITGVGVVLATRILAHQNVTSWSELVEQTKISPKMLSSLRGYLFL
jgi:hypothetical protein